MLTKLQNFFSFFINRYAPAFITLVILAGVFFFYFNVVVSRNEANLKERNFRGLDRMANNISQKISNYAEKNSQNFFIAWLKSGSDKNLQSFIRSEYGLEYVPRDSNASNSSFYVKYSDGWKFVFKDTTPKTGRLATVPVQSFTEPLLRRDLFSYYLLAIDDNILLDELNISNNNVKEYLPDDYAMDTLKKSIIHAGQIRNVEIGGKEFKLFFLPFIVEGKYKFSLGGYIAAESYNSQKKYIPTYAILWLVIGLIVVVLMFPLLKVFLMHPSEQLLSRNAVSSLASIHILGSIVVLVAINIYLYFAIIKGSVEKTLKDLANDIELNLTSEVNAALKQMDAAEMKIKDTLDRNRDSFPKDYPYATNISWTDSTGLQKIRWSNLVYPASKTYVNDRDYFLAIKESNLWHRDKGKPYYLTQVSSWVSNKKLAIISRPVLNSAVGKDSLNMMMITLSGRFNSMFNSVLPVGFGFCVIRGDGRVVFHQDEERNFNENLVEETNENTTLISLLRMRTTGYFGSMYSGTTQRFYVKPIAGMPYFVITFREMRSIWSEDLDVISATSILTLLNLAVILVAIIVIQAAGYRHSLLQKQSILFTWLQPNINLRHAYKRVTWVYISAIVLQLIFFLAYTGRDYLYQVGICFSYAYILISYAYVQFAIASNQKDEGKRLENQRPLLILILIYVASIAVFLVFSLRSGRYWFFLSQVYLLFIAYQISGGKSFGTRIRSAADQKKRDDDEDPNSYKEWYGQSVCLFIAATAIVPSVIFYFLIFKQERLLCLKFCQAEFVNKLIQDPRPGISEGDLKLSYIQPYYYSSFAARIRRHQLNPDTTEAEEENKFEALYKEIKPPFSAYSRQIEFLKTPKDSTREIRWSYLSNGGSLSLHSKIFSARAFGDSSLGLSVYSPLKNTSQRIWETTKKDTASFILLLIVLLVLIWGFQRLLRHLIEKVFFDGYNTAGLLRDFDNSFITDLSVNGKANEENLIINGLINSGKYKHLIKTCQRPPVEIDIATFSPPTDLSAVIKSNIDKVKQERTLLGDEKLIVVVIRHFEMFMDDLKLTAAKLGLLESLLLEKKIRIIILSSRSLESMILKGAIEDGKEIDLTDRWSNIMNQFYTVYHRWEIPDGTTNDQKFKTEQVLIKFYREKIDQIWKLEPRQDPEKIDEKYNEIKTYLTDQINKFFQKLEDECSHSDFLWGMRDPILEYIEKNQKDCLRLDLRYRNKSHIIKNIKSSFNDLYEQICIKIQTLACKYYLASWNSLSYNERKTLYDIARDEMVNPANRDIATRLACLGLIKQLDGGVGYEIMSKSFRNFMFTQLDKKDVDSFQVEAADKGSWRNFQLPILIVVIAISIFLFTTQRDAYSNLITYLGSVALGVGTLLKLLGMIPSSK